MSTHAGDFIPLSNIPPAPDTGARTELREAWDGALDGSTHDLRWDDLPPGQKGILTRFAAALLASRAVPPAGQGEAVGGGANPSRSKKMKMLTMQDAEKIGRIVERAAFHGVIPFTSGNDYRDVLADVHLGPCPLDLDGLLEARHNDFAHDMHGLFVHFNRETQLLEDCFLPRHHAR